MARRAVAIVIQRQDGRFLTVKRPRDGSDLSDVWGLPAVNLREGEHPECAAVRVGQEKLGVEVSVKRCVGTERVRWPEYDLELTEFEVELISGVPRVPQTDPSITQYVATRFTSDLSTLLTAARRGSACCRLLLQDRGRSWGDVDHPRPGPTSVRLG